MKSAFIATGFTRLKELLSQDNLLLHAHKSKATIYFILRIPLRNEIRPNLTKINQNKMNSTRYISFSIGRPSGTLDNTESLNVRGSIDFFFYFFRNRMKEVIAEANRQTRIQSYLLVRESVMRKF